MSFNDYLKYVKGHAKETSLAYGYADRLCTAIRRIVAERLGDSYFDLTDRLTPSYTEIESDDYVTIKYSNYVRTVKIIADLEDYEIKISSKTNANALNDDLGLSAYDDYSVSNKRKISYDLYELLRYASTHYGKLATEDLLNDEVANYIVNGRDTIGKENIIINVMVIYTIKALESIDFFYTDIDEDDDVHADEEFRRKIMEMAAEGYDDEEAIPEEYRSSEPGPAAHPDDGNTKADESAESGI